MNEKKTAPRMQTAVTPKRIDAEEFRAILKDLTDGKQVTQQELADACVYADRLPELKALTKALLSGLQIAMTRINYKNQRIGRLERQLEAARRIARKEAGNAST